jgi:hypothetical protein
MQIPLAASHDIFLMILRFVILSDDLLAGTLSLLQLVVRRAEALLTGGAHGPAGQK